MLPVVLGCWHPNLGTNEAVLLGVLPFTKRTEPYLFGPFWRAVPVPGPSTGLQIYTILPQPHYLLCPLLHFSLKQMLFLRALAKNPSWIWTCLRDWLQQKNVISIHMSFYQNLWQTKFLLKLTLLYNWCILPSKFSCILHSGSIPACNVTVHDVAFNVYSCYLPMSSFSLSYIVLSFMLLLIYSAWITLPCFIHAVLNSNMFP